MTPLDLDEMERVAGEPEGIRMDAYYYGFSFTGARMIDRILSAVACAGKAYHHTDSWNDECSPYEDVHRGKTCADWIQNAAIDAAEERKALIATIREQRALLQEAEAIIREQDWPYFTARIRAALEKTT